MDLLSCAKEIYSGYQVNNRWKIGTFWRRANTLEACIRFIDAAYSRWPTDPGVQKMLNDVTNRLYNKGPQGPQTEGQFLQSKLDDPDVWADDFFWCGAASLSAHDFLLSRYASNRDPGLEEAAQGYLSIAQTSWLRQVGTGYDLATEAAPVPHGCRNSTASADANPIGIKNTVTNAGLFLLSLRLYNALENTPQQTAAAQGYLKMAYAQYLWFSGWFPKPNTLESNYPRPYLSLIDLGGGKQGGLVTDRPQGSENDIVPYTPGCVWSGDQGLVLAALAGMLQIQDELTTYVQDHVDPSFYQAAFQQDVSAAIGHIATGTQNLLFGVDGIVREAPFRVLMQDDYSTDYASGRGVLLRCLALPEVKAALPQDVSFDDCLTSTADALCGPTLGTAPTYQVSDDLGVGKPDTEFQQQFEQLWGFGDAPTVSWQWPPGQPAQQEKNAVLQAVGLDVLGATIPLA